MPQISHARAAELHRLAAQAHQAAAEAHQRQDHLTAHELSQQALEQSLFAQQHSVEVHAEANHRHPHPFSKTRATPS